VGLAVHAEHLGCLGPTQPKDESAAAPTVPFEWVAAAATPADAAVARPH
jgi:hypothetical protein